MLSKLCLYLLLAFVVSINAQCTYGTLSQEGITLLPENTDLSISFGADSTLEVVTLIEQVDPDARDTFTYNFNHPTTGVTCNLAAATEGAEVEDPDDSSCQVPVQSTFDWPPANDCFLKQVVGDHDVFTAELRVSWEEHLTVNGIDFDRVVSVEFPVVISIPNAIFVTSSFVSSSSSTIDAIDQFLISSLNFEVLDATSTTFTVRIATLTEAVATQQLKLKSLVPLDGGVVTQIGTGTMNNGFYQQTWEWVVSKPCNGFTESYEFRGEFDCVTPGENGCSDTELLGEFEDITLSLVTSSACPDTTVNDFVATATLQLKDANNVVKAVFSNLDTLRAAITYITSESILVSAVVDKVTVNTVEWTEGVEYEVDDTDAKHPVVVFDPLAQLMTDGDLNNDAVDANELRIDLILTWSQGGVSGKTVSRALRGLTLPDSTSAQKQFQIVSEQANAASAVSVSAPLIAFVAAVFFYLM